MFSCAVDLFIYESGVLNVPIIVMWDTMSVVRSLRFIINIQVPVQGVYIYIFTMVISSCFIDFLIIT